MERYICPECGAIVKEEEGYCMTCGIPITEVIERQDELENN